MREIVRQFFTLRRGTAPRVTATLLHEPDTAESSLELVNEGGAVVQVRCVIKGDAGAQEVTIRTLGPGESRVIQTADPKPRPLE